MHTTKATTLLTPFSHLLSLRPDTIPALVSLRHACSHTTSQHYALQRLCSSMPVSSQPNSIVHPEPGEATAAYLTLHVTQQVDNYSSSEPDATTSCHAANTGHDMTEAGSRCTSALKATNTIKKNGASSTCLLYTSPSPRD